MPVQATDLDVIIIGAGVAGMLCAATAGQRVLLIDHVEKRAEKNRIAGSRRCNFTNLDCRSKDFISRDPHFARSTLSQRTMHACDVPGLYFIG